MFYPNKDMEIEMFLEPNDPDDLADIDPVGNIELRAGGAILSEVYVYLDSWLNALKVGSKAITETNRVELDLVEEPEPLVLERTGNGIRISFKEKSIVIKNGEELEIAVENALRELVDRQLFPTSRQKNHE